jgi:hypothetical protein
MMLLLEAFHHYKKDANGQKSTKKGSTLGFWKRGEVIVARNCNKESWNVLAL